MYIRVCVCVFKGVCVCLRVSLMECLRVSLMECLRVSLMKLTTAIPSLGFPSPMTRPVSLKWSLISADTVFVILCVLANREMHYIEKIQNDTNYSER